MSIQETDNRPGSAEPFPANENSIYPPKGTAKTIVSFALGIALMVGLFAFASHHTGPNGNQTPATLGAPSPAGANGQN